YEGDPTKYRAVDEVRQWEQRDPLTSVASSLDERGLSVERERIEAGVREALAVAEATADAAAYPEPGTFPSLVQAEEPPIEPRPVEPQPGSTYKLMNAVHDALEHSLAADEDVLLAGIDV